MVKRRIVGVITVRSGWAVQSFGYQRYLPLGRPECLAENLDRWGADEIVVQAIDRSANGAGPDFDVLTRISALGLSTPLVYAGGVSTAAQAARVIAAGADRVGVDALLRSDTSAVIAIADVIGAQAVVAVTPMTIEGGRAEWLDYRTRRCDPAPRLRDVLGPLVDGRHVSEVMLVDARHDGDLGPFELELIERFPIPDLPIIAVGGAGDPATAARLLGHRRVSAVAVGNRLSYQEHAIQALRRMVAEADVRPPRFVTSEMGW